MHCVYLLQSAVDHRRHSTGFTHNLRARLASHHAGQKPSTVQGRPRHLVSYFAFADVSQRLHQPANRVIARWFIGETSAGHHPAPFVRVRMRTRK